MKNFAYILLFIVWMGGMSTSFLTVIIELIHWVAQKNEDQHSLPRRFWAAFAFFAITVLIALRSQILPWIEEITSGITIIPLILRSAAVLFILLLVLLFTLFLCKKVMPFGETHPASTTMSRRKKRLLHFCLLSGSS